MYKNELVEDISVGNVTNKIDEKNSRNGKERLSTDYYVFLERKEQS